MQNALHIKERVNYAVKVVENQSLSDEENLEALETEVRPPPALAERGFVLSGGAGACADQDFEAVAASAHSRPERSRDEPAEHVHRDGIVRARPRAACVRCPSRALAADLGRPALRPGWRVASCSSGS